MPRTARHSTHPPQSLPRCVHPFAVYFTIFAAVKPPTTSASNARKISQPFSNSFWTLQTNIRFISATHKIPDSRLSFVQIDDEASASGRNPFAMPAPVLHHPSGSYAVVCDQWIFGGERNVHVRLQHLRDVWPRNIHPLGQCRLVKSELLHPAENLAEKDGADMVNGIHEEEGGEKRWRWTAVI